MSDQTTTEPSTKISRIEDRLDRSTLAEVAATGGGVQFRTMTEVMEFAKLVSLSGVAVPPHLRGNPGACLAVCVQAMEWKMSPFAVANKSYVVSNYSKDGPIERLSYESQLIHAVIEARAPLQGRLRVDYEGDGDDRVCIVSGRFRGETEDHVLRSSPLGKRRPGRNDKGFIKGSPLWDSKPDLQQFYDTSRDWCRMFCPDVLMGIYAPDEFEEITPIEPKDVSPKLMERLPGAVDGASGFNADIVDQGLAEEVQATEGEKSGRKTKTKAAVKATPKSAAPPETAKEYIAYVEDYVATYDDPDALEARYGGENAMRDELTVRISDRNKLAKLIEERIIQLRK